MKRIFIFIVYLLSSCSGQADELPGVTATLHGEPSSYVAGCINAITGDLGMSECDLIVESAVPLVIHHSYSSGMAGEPQAGWNFISHCTLNAYDHAIIVAEPNGGYITYKLIDEKRGMLVFAPETDDTRLGSTNTSSSILSGRTHVDNRRLYATYKTKTTETLGKKKIPKDITIVGGDGLRKYYRPLPHRDFTHVLVKEELDSGAWILYSIDKEGRPTEIKTVSPNEKQLFSWARFDYDGKGSSYYNCVVRTSDGKQLRYHFDKIPFHKNLHQYTLSLIDGDIPSCRRFISPDHPEHGHTLVTEVWRGSVLEKKWTYEYGKNNKSNRSYQTRKSKVRDFFEPAGPNGEWVNTYHFDYYYSKWKEGAFAMDSLTRIHGVLGFMEEIQWSKYFRPHRISFYDRSHSSSPIVVHQIMWGKEKSSESGDLKTWVLGDEHAQGGYVRGFVYDERHNPIQHTFTGKLTGEKLCTSIFPHGGETKGDGENYSHNYTYSTDGRNLLLEDKEENGKSMRYVYLPGTNLLFARFICDRGRIIQREFFEYDQNHLCIEERVCDGVSENIADLRDVHVRRLRRIKRYENGLIKNIETAWDEPQKGKNGVITGSIFYYSSANRVIQQDIYDSEKQVIYSLFFTYDHLQRMTGKTNPLNQWTTYTYDALGRCSKVLDETTGITTIYTYTAKDLISQEEKIARDGQRRVFKYTYNALGFKTSATDYLGNTTTYTNDALGRVIAIDYPNGTRESFAYDAMNNPILCVSKSGDVTKKEYNAYGKPTTVTYSDGSVERFYYHRDGTLREEVHPLGSKTRYTYDVLGRVLSKRVFDPSETCIREEKWEYRGLGLFSYTNAEEETTFFGCDGFGRKTYERKGEKVISFFYDHLGRVSSIDHGEYREEKTYDLLDRVTVEKIVSKEGNLQQQTTYVYDAFGNKIEIIRKGSERDIVDRFVFDGFGREIEHIDGSGATITTIYDESKGYLEKTTIDSLGTKHIERFGSMGEKIHLEIISAAGDRLLSEIYHYNALGLCTQTESVLSGRSVFLEKQFDARGFLTTLIEGKGSNQEKITRYSYMPGGFLLTVHKNDGTYLTHTYDTIGRRTSTKASTGEGYAYIYDRLNRVIQVRDLITNRISKRTYDETSGEISAELFLHGLQIDYIRDVYGRVTEILFPDGSAIQYAYKGVHRISCSRLNRKRELLYETTFDAYDLLGNLSEATLPSGDKELYLYDEAGRLEEIRSPWLSSRIERRDAAGNPLQCKEGSQTRLFTYDPLSQLQSEVSPFFVHSYAFDAHSTLLVKDGVKRVINSLYQEDEGRYQYDAVSRLIDDGSYTYTYDVFDRLISVEDPGKVKAEYVYDGWHRRMQSIIYIWEEGAWRLRKGISFLCEGNIEICALDMQGNMIEMRALGASQRTEGLSTTALELYGKVYVPFHNISQHIAGIVDIATGWVTERYDYNVFGEKVVFDGEGNLLSWAQNPWGYFGKRLDEVGDLLYFGRRYYHKGLCSWISPDPLGMIDSANLYAFLRGNPLHFFDPDGLASIDFDSMAVDRPSRHRENTPVSHALEKTFSAAAMPIGYTLYGVGVHFPLPYIRDGIVDIAAVLTQKPGLKAEHSRFEYIAGNAMPGRSASYVCGINTPKEEALLSAQFLSYACKGLGISTLCGATHGLVNDVMRAFCEVHLGLNTHRVDQLYNYWVNQISKIAKESPDDYLHIHFAYSEGGAVTDNAFKRLSSTHPELAKHLFILTYNSAAVIDNGLAFKVDQRASKWDPIRFFDVVGNLKNPNAVQVVDPIGSFPGLDHGFFNKTGEFTWLDMCQSLPIQGRSNQ